MDTTKWLALETSSQTGTVALAYGAAVAERSIETPRAQTERLLPLVDELLAEAGLRLADLDAIAFGRGPGSFTGLRVAAALAQGLALAASLPVVAVSSLAALAERAAREHGATQVLSCVDAHMGEVYWAVHGSDEGLMRLRGEERLGPPEEVELSAPGAWHGAGSGWERYAEVLAPLAGRADGVDAALYPRARDLLPQAAAHLREGKVLEPERALPVYLRSEKAWKRAT